MYAIRSYYDAHGVGVPFLVDRQLDRLAAAEAGHHLAPLVAALDRGHVGEADEASVSYNFV